MTIPLERPSTEIQELVEDLIAQEREYGKGNISPQYTDAAKTKLLAALGALEEDKQRLEDQAFRQRMDSIEREGEYITELEMLRGCADPNVEAYTTIGGDLIVRLVDEDAPLVKLAQPEGDHVHTFLDSAIALIGADWPREEIVEAFRAAPEIRITGEHAQSMKHGIAVEHRGQTVFVETAQRTDHA